MVRKPAQLTHQYFHFHVVPGIIDTSKDRTFKLFISNFSTTMKLLPKRMVEACAVEVPAAIFNLPHKQANRIPQKDSNLVYPTNTIDKTKDRRVKGFSTS